MPFVDHEDIEHEKPRKARAEARTLLRHAVGEDPKECFQAWHRCFGDVDPALFRRCKGAWDTVEAVLSSKAGTKTKGGGPCSRPEPYQEIVDSFRAGATLERCDEVVYKLFDLEYMHPSAALFWRLRDGQDVWSSFIRANPSMGDVAQAPMGLFGGQHVYGEFSNVRMLSLRDALVVNAHLKSSEEDPFPDTDAVEPDDYRFPIAANFEGTHVVCVDVFSGEVFVNDDDEEQGRRAHPYGIDIIGWFEEYTRRLAAGVYRVQADPDLPDNMRVITRFPQATLQENFPSSGDSDLCRREARMVSGITPADSTVFEAVTKGVRIRVSTVLQSGYGMSAASGNPERMFAYSVRMDLLSVEEQLRRWDADAGLRAASGDPPETRFTPLTSVQLKSRMWIITDCDGHEHETMGDAVIGLYPLLKAATSGGPEVASPPFVYQSCTACKLPGTMEGGFNFVEGSISQPTGPGFFVQCPLFRLEYPDYLFGF
uniref:ApaG domain-containing protein n=1 Tax=Mantoniella antarctica TaxID=81844 RepID=A0A7S0S907_9CHLO